MEYQHSVNFVCVVENLYCYFKQIISYEDKVEKIRQFLYDYRWLIFACPVTIICHSKYTFIWYTLINVM